MAEDGTHFICGVLPRLGRTPDAALIDTVDANGKHLRERLFYSKTSMDELSAYLSKCLIFDNLLIGIGTKSTGKINSEENWIVALNMNGEVVWEREFKRINSKPLASLQGITTSRQRDFLAIANTDNVNTDIFLIANDGSIVRSISLGGRYLFVEDERNRAGPLELYGDAKDGDVRKTKLIRLNIADDSISTTETAIPFIPFIAMSVIRMEDGTLVGFGSIWTPNTSVYHSGIALVGCDLKSHSLEEIQLREGFPGGQVLAATVSPGGGFAALTPILGKT